MRTIIVLAFILTTPLWAQPGPSLEARIAAAAAKLDTGSAIVADDIRIQGFPIFRVENFELVVTRPRFDKMLRNWTVEVHCLPGSACIPFLATIAGGHDLALVRPGKTRYLVHAGERSSLTFAIGDVRIKREVICLQPGRSGDFIRVRFAGKSTVTYGRVSDSGSITAQEMR